MLFVWLKNPVSKRLLECKASLSSFTDPDGNINSGLYTAYDHSQIPSIISNTLAMRPKQIEIIIISDTVYTGRGATR